ncbi:hypothetical protein ACIQ8D_35465 [Streptomyces sp. NPDC096094]|uniref:hypothetical protein n=1 Tax=Streptomyces sp. NPDC096094 TaxID=3366073 RepID=UPI0038143497
MRLSASLLADAGHSGHRTLAAAAARSADLPSGHTGPSPDVVAVREAWQVLARWAAAGGRRHPHLAAATARSHQSTSDQDPAEGLPPAGEAHCRYLAEWEDMKLRYALSADEAEAAALREVADGCPEQTVTYEPTP